MNSINAQQPEDNHENLVGEAAIEKIRELAKAADTCFFCTAIQTGQRVETRPMAIQDVDRVVVMAKMIVGAVTGKTLDDSIEGSLRVRA